MYLLDTDMMTLLERGNPEVERFKARLASVPPDDVATTIVSYEEQTRGWLAVSLQAKTPSAQVAAYTRLKAHLRIYCRIAVVDYDEAAAREFERLRQTPVRIGTMDLKIASIVLANNATLITRNLSDFSRVPRLIVEDWS